MIETAHFNAPPQMHIPPPNLSGPPPGMPNLSMPPPNLVGQEHTMSGNLTQINRTQFYNRPFFKPFQNFAGPRGPIGQMTLDDFDGKRLRKSVMRKTVDYNSSIIKALECRVWQRDFRDRRALQPDVMYYPDMMPPPSYPDNPINCVTTRFVKTATNKMRCPIFCMAWTPEGRRLVTGASSGEFTLWNGLTFNFETILQAHDSPVRTMVWSHNDSWMVTGDHTGYIKYWQSNMNNVKMFQAHKEALRGISFSPSDTKFVTCSDDGTLRIWDFMRCYEERILRGHGADVKCVHWHPQKGIVISGSKDNQQPIKLWDPKTGQSLATLHAHKSTVMDLKWNENGNWLITASRDHLLKLFDLRNLSQEVQTFRGHKKEASSVAWHPTHEGLFCSGGSDGAIMFWHVGADKEVGAIEQAHESIVWTLAWHPLGHILCSGSNDHTSKFWTRNRPGDQMRDKYNLNTLPAGISGLDDVDIDEPSAIPGMGPEDKVDLTALSSNSDNQTIPGLDLDSISASNNDANKAKKVPYSKPIPRNFQAQWNETGEEGGDTISEVISHIVENTPGVVPLQKIEPSAIIVYGKVIPVEPGSKLETVIAEGPEALKKYIASGAIEELHDVMPHDDEEHEFNDDENYENNSRPGEKRKRSRFSDVQDSDIDLRPMSMMPQYLQQKQAENRESSRGSFGSGDGRDFDARMPPPSIMNQDTDLRNNDFRSQDSDFRRGEFHQNQNDYRNNGPRSNMWNSQSKMDQMDQMSSFNMRGPPPSYNSAQSGGMQNMPPPNYRSGPFGMPPPSYNSNFRPEFRSQGGGGNMEGSWSNQSPSRGSDFRPRGGGGYAPPRGPPSRGGQGQRGPNRGPYSGPPRGSWPSRGRNY